MEDDLLSRTQNKVFECICTWVQTYGVAPTTQEIADAIGRSPALARRITFDLERLGYLKIHRSKWRGISVLVWPDEMKAAA